MSNGGTLLELDAQVDALVGALVLHKAVVEDMEERIVAGTADECAPDVVAVHRAIVAEYMTEIALLRAEIALIPQQRRETFGS